MIYVYLCRQLSNKRPFSPLLLDVRADCQNSLSPSSVSRPPHGASAAHLQGQVRGSLTAACHIKTSLTIFDTFTSEKDHESMIQKSFPSDSGNPSFFDLLPAFFCTIRTPSQNQMHSASPQACGRKRLGGGQLHEERGLDIDLVASRTSPPRARTTHSSLQLLTGKQSQRSMAVRPVYAGPRRFSSKPVQ